MNTVHVKLKVRNYTLIPPVPASVRSWLKLLWCVIHLYIIGIQSVMQYQCSNLVNKGWQDIEAYLVRSLELRLFLR